MLPIAGQRLDRMDQNFLWRGVFQAKKNRNFFFEIFFQIFFLKIFFHRQRRALQLVLNKF